MYELLSLATFEVITCTCVLLTPACVSGSFSDWDGVKVQGSGIQQCENKLAKPWTQTRVSDYNYMSGWNRSLLKLWNVWPGMSFLSSGTLQTCSLINTVRKEDLVFSEYLTTLLVPVTRSVSTNVFLHLYLYYDMCCFVCVNVLLHMFLALERAICDGRGPMNLCQSLWFRGPAGELL